MKCACGATLAAAIALTSPAVAERIDQCGFIEGPLFGCHFFLPFVPETTSDYVLDIETLPDSLLWTPVRVVGDVVYCQHVCDQYTFPYCITNYTLSVCPSRDLGCGVVSRWGDEHEGCWYWVSPTYGELNASPHGYAPGDTVHAFGVAGPCASICFGNGCLWNEVFSVCSDTVSAAEGTTWGMLKNIFR